MPGALSPEGLGVHQSVPAIEAPVVAPPPATPVEGKGEGDGAGEPPVAEETKKTDWRDKLSENQQEFQPVIDQAEQTAEKLVEAGFYGNLPPEDKKDVDDAIAMIKYVNGSGAGQYDPETQDFVRPDGTADNLKRHHKITLDLVHAATTAEEVGEDNKKAANEVCDKLWGRKIEETINEKPGYRFNLEAPRNDSSLIVRGLRFVDNYVSYCKDNKKGLTQEQSGIFLRALDVQLALRQADSDALPASAKVQILGQLMANSDFQAHTLQQLNVTEVDQSGRQTNTDVTLTGLLDEVSFTNKVNTRDGERNLVAEHIYETRNNRIAEDKRAEFRAGLNQSPALELVAAVDQTAFNIAAANNAGVLGGLLERFSVNLGRFAASSNKGLEMLIAASPEIVTNLARSIYGSTEGMNEANLRDGLAKKLGRELPKGMDYERYGIIGFFGGSLLLQMMGETDEGAAESHG